MIRVVGAGWPRKANRSPTGFTRAHISDQHLFYRYRRALALVFSCKYEGFGSTAVEAMTLECPVLCSPVASLPEVGGSAALFVEQTAGSYLDAMRRLAT
jgi:glycosyltransferase involved in cell wall biosynthesis